MKKVLLGFADEFIPSSEAKNLDFTTNKVGGLPDWHKPESIDDPFKCAVTCRICGYPAPMVVQIYAPLEESEYHRTLYIFACVSPGCWNRSESWVCVRQQSKDAASITPIQVESTGDEFCDEPTEWNTYSTADKLTLSSLAEALRNIVKPNNPKKFDQQSSSNKTSTNVRPNSIVLSEGSGSTPISTVSITDVKEVTVNAEEDTAMEVIDPGTEKEDVSTDVVAEAMMTEDNVEEGNSSVHTEDESQKDEKVADEEAEVIPEGSHIFEELQSRCEAFTPMFIYVEQENDKKEKATEEKKENVPEVSEIVTEESVGEVYEKATPAHGDAMFHALMSKIGNNPGQIIRYCRDNAAPLLLRKTPNAAPMRCSYCQSEMVFELQILPTIITHLTPDNVSFGIHYPLDFGSAFVYTCRNSCWNDEEDVRAELVIVHAENNNRNTRRRHL